jgi:hypothetical protein
MLEETRSNDFTMQLGNTSSLAAELADVNTPLSPRNVGKLPSARLMSHYVKKGLAVKKIFNENLSINFWSTLITFIST